VTSPRDYGIASAEEVILVVSPLKDSGAAHTFRVGFSCRVAAGDDNIEFRELGEQGK
jgi:hypothetical protein